MPGDTFELVGGPQDGAKVKQVRVAMAETIYLGAVWKGDGYAAYSSGCCDMFPCRYVMDGDKFVYRLLQDG